MEVVVTTGAYKSCKALVKSSLPTNQHPVFTSATHSIARSLLRQRVCPSVRPSQPVLC